MVCRAPATRIELRWRQISSLDEWACIRGCPEYDLCRAIVWTMGSHTSLLASAGFDQLFIFTVRFFSYDVSAFWPHSVAPSAKPSTLHAWMFSGLKTSPGAK
jgi:hypothetical protein